MGFFCEIATGGVRSRGKIIQVNELSQHITLAQDSKSELYRSLYTFDEEIVDHVRVHKSIRNFTGNHYLGRIILDIDKQNDTGDALIVKARNVFEFLTDQLLIPTEAILIYFSGTGFHIVFPDVFHFNPSPDLPRIVSATLMKVFKDFYIDDIYSNPTRLIRVAGTINNKTLLHKTMIPYGDLYTSSYEDILKRSQFPSNGSTGRYSGILPDHSEKKSPVYVQPRLSLGQARMNGNVTQYVTCMQHLYNRGPIEGRRHTDILRLASALRRGGLTLNAAITVIESWVPTLEKEHITSSVRDIYKREYPYSCNDPVMKEFCDTRCIFHRGKNYTVEAVGMETLSQSYHDKIASGFYGQELDLSEYYKMGSFRIERGELVLVWGDSGIGKSAWVQDIAVRMRPRPVLYIPTEMDDHLSFRRFVQIAKRMTKDEVIALYSNGSTPQIAELEHIKLVTVQTDIAAIAKVVADTKAEHVVIDTIDGIKTQAQRSLERDDEIILGLKNIAQQHKCIIWGVHHISKSAAYELQGGSHLSLHSGKGSSSAEQKADKVIGIELLSSPGMRKIHSLKARDEAPFDIRAMFDFTTFTYKQLPGSGGWIE